MGGEFQGCWQGIDISGAGIGALLFAFVSVVLYSVALGTTHWADSSDDVSMGLFKYCATTCNEYEDDLFNGKRSSLNLVTRTEVATAFVALGIIFTLAAVVVVTFTLGRRGYQDSVFRASFFLFFAGLMGIVAMAVFADIQRQLTGFSTGYSFALEITAWALNIVGAFLLIVDSRNISYLDPEVAARHGGAGMI